MTISDGIKRVACGNNKMGLAMLCEKAGAFQGWWPNVWVYVRNQCTYTGEVNGLLDILLPSKVPRRQREMRGTISKDRRWGGKRQLQPRIIFKADHRDFTHGLTFCWVNLVQFCTVVLHTTPTSDQISHLPIPPERGCAAKNMGLAFIAFSTRKK